MRDSACADVEEWGEEGARNTTNNAAVVVLHVPPFVVA